MKQAWNKWKKISKRVGDFQAGVIFSFLYFVIIFPVGVVANYFADYLSIRKFPSWRSIDDYTSSLSKIKLQ